MTTWNGNGHGNYLGIMVKVMVMGKVMAMLKVMSASFAIGLPGFS